MTELTMSQFASREDYDRALLERAARADLSKPCPFCPAGPHYICGHVGNVGEGVCLTCAANHYCPTHNPAPAGARKEWCPECNEAICPGCDAASLAEGEAK